MLNYVIHDKSNSSFLWFYCDFIDGENEEKAIITLAYEVMQGLQVYEWFRDNFKRLINASKINHLTIKEQSDKWYSHTNLSDNKRALAELVMNIKIKNDRCQGYLWLTKNIAHKMDECKHAVKLGFETNKKDDESTEGAL